VTKTANILFIETNSDTKLQVMAKISGRYNCDIMTADNLAEALKCIKKRWYDIILINVKECSDIATEIEKLMTLRQVETVPIIGVISPNIYIESDEPQGFMDKLKKLVKSDGDTKKVIINEAIYEKIYSAPFQDEVLDDDVLGKHLKAAACEKDPNAPSVKVSWDVMEALKLLKLNPYSTENEIKLRYRQLVKKHHPDNGGDDQELLQRITEAYDIVSKADIGK
jgi:vacuolar-type H+-ATPase subunit F/Vma7